MNNDNKSIHDFDFDLICEYFSSIERQGPGSPEVTIKALSFIEDLNENSRIADLGCGTGTQTMTYIRTNHRFRFVSCFYRHFQLPCQSVELTRSGKGNCRFNGQSSIQ